MKDNIFREYDIRGLVDQEIDINNINKLTKAILKYFAKQDNKIKNIIVGMDGRTHSPIIKQKVIEAANQSGISVIDIGLVPTPVFYFALFSPNLPEASSGLIITASHNPKDYNGMKICLNTKSVWGTQIKEIKNIYKHDSNLENFKINNININNRHECLRKHDIVTEYIDWMTEHFSHLKNLDINAVIDCGNGTAGVIFPRLIKAMGWKNVKLLFEEVDGNFPNHEANPTNIENMTDILKILQSKNYNYNVGIGLDGDCDRMNPMTKSGVLVPGDKLLALYSKAIVETSIVDTNISNNISSDISIVFDIKSSDALVEYLESIGVKPCVAPSGHSIIKDHLYKNNAKLAGEISCHFFFNDRYFGYDDGIYAGLRLFELLENSDQTFDEMLKTLPKKVSSPEYRITCADDKKSIVVNGVKKIFGARKDCELITIDGVKAITPYGWGLVRASNTQPAICLRFESDTQEGLEKVRNDFCKALEPHFSKETLFKCKR